MINILLLNWNSAELVSNSLNKLTKSSDPNFRVILINNFSSPTDLYRVREICKYFSSYFDLFLVENETNIGYAGGNNKGLEYLDENKLSGDILILNPDILVSENTISEMRKGLREGIGIVTARVVNPKNKILFDAIKLLGFQQKYLITPYHEIETEYSQGACLLIKRDIIDKIGLFDERFFLYWEEVDFSLRVRKIGARLIATTSTQVVRLNNETTRQPQAFYYSVRNALLIKSKHPDFFNKLDYLIYLLYMLLLTIKFLPNFKIFALTIRNIFSAINDSHKSKYYRREETH
jgi:GT2 family glycosyltransferase